MENTFTLVLFFLIIQICSSQNTYEKGYFINNDDVKTSCYILNMDWRNNPSQIEYKKSLSSEIQVKTIDEIKEFAIIDISKYVRVDIDIDRSRHKARFLTTNKEPVFKNEKLFLKVLVEGDANLYSYVDSNLFRYFIKTSDSEIKQLVFKLYVAADKVDLLENNAYKQVLYNTLKCDDITLTSIENLSYKKRELVKIFEKYNNCKTPNYDSNSKNKKEININLSPRFGINTAKLSVNSAVSSFDMSFDSATNLRLGLEFEYVLSFNNGKWGALLEPYYNTYKGEIVTEDYEASVDYKYLKVSFGLRHYMYLNEKSKVFVNGNYIVPVVGFSNPQIKHSFRSFPINSAHHVALGIGYNLNDKFSIEAKYEFHNEIFAGINGLGSVFSNASINFGYNLF